MPKYVVVPEVIHHAPTIVSVPTHPEPFPYNDKWPPDPAVYAPVIAYACRLLDEGMGR